MDQIVYPRAIPDGSFATTKVVSSKAATLAVLAPGSAVAEVGVRHGDFTQMLLEDTTIGKVLAIDHYDLHIRTGGEDPRLNGLEHGAFVQTRFKRYLDDGKLEIVLGRRDAIKALDPGMVGAFFISGCRVFAQLMDELYMCDAKLPRGGLIWIGDYIMADYTTGEPYEVVRAVNEFVAQKSYEVVYFVLESNMFCSVMVRRPA